MKRIYSSICDDVTLFKGNDSSTYCQYFKLKVPNLTLSRFHLDFFIIDHIDKVYHFVIPHSQSSERRKRVFFPGSFRMAHLGFSQETPPLYLSITP